MVVHRHAPNFADQSLLEAAAALMHRKLRPIWHIEHRQGTGLRTASEKFGSLTPAINTLPFMCYPF
jgi:hypothetical protein